MEESTQTERKTDLMDFDARGSDDTDADKSSASVDGEPAIGAKVMIALWVEMI